MKYLKNMETKIVTKIAWEIGKLALLWAAIVPWAADILEYSWKWSSTMTEIALATIVSIAGYYGIGNIKELYGRLEQVKEERKNLKKGKEAKKASSLFFRF